MNRLYAIWLDESSRTASVFAMTVIGFGSVCVLLMHGCQ